MGRGCTARASDSFASRTVPTSLPIQSSGSRHPSTSFPTASGKTIHQASISHAGATAMMLPGHRAPFSSASIRAAAATWAGSTASQSSCARTASTPRAADFLARDLRDPPRAVASLLLGRVLDEHERLAAGLDGPREVGPQPFDEVAEGLRVVIVLAEHEHDASCEALRPARRPRFFFTEALRRASPRTRAPRARESPASTMRLTSSVLIAGIRASPVFGSRSQTMSSSGRSRFTSAGECVAIKNWVRSRCAPEQLDQAIEDVGVEAVVDLLDAREQRGRRVVQHR